MNLPVILMVLAGLLAFYYLEFELSRPENPRRSIFKTLPVLLLALAAILAGLAPLIIAGLIACAIGDYWLSLEGEKNFLLGLGAFLIGHLLYTGFFTSQFSTNQFYQPQAIQLALILLALGFLVIFRLWAFLQEMKLPVIIYTAAISIMALSAKIAEPGFIALSGICLFIFSDIILANDHFTPLTNSKTRRLMPYMVWSFYFCGQALITYGIYMIS